MDIFQLKNLKFSIRNDYNMNYTKGLFLHFIIGSLLLTLTFADGVFAQKKLTLKDAVSIALQKNVNVQKTETGLRASESNLKAAYGRLLPGVDADASWNWSNTKTTVQTPAGDVSADFQNRSYKAGINAGMILYDGFSNYAGYDKAKLSTESAALVIKQTKQEIVFQVYTAYFDILSAKELMKVKEEDLNWNKKNLEIIQERNKLGSVTLADVYAQQVKVGNAELELIRAKNSYEKGVTQLVYLLGLDVLENYELDETSTLESRNTVSGNDLADMVKKALEQRTDYKISKLALQSAGYDLSMAKAAYSPVIRGTTGYNFNSSTLSTLTGNRTFSAGLSLSIPVFSGWSLDNAVEQAEVQIKNKQIELADIEKFIKKSIRENLLELTTAEKLVDVSKSNVLAAEEQRRIEQEKYSLGSTTLLNVLIAQSELTNAKTNLISSQYQDKKLKEQLMYLLGLTEISY